LPRGKADDSRNDIPPDAWKAFQAHRDNSRRRHIEFLFDAITWWEWWQTDNRWANRGMGADKFVMSRKNDTGPYSPENVLCITHRENMAQISYKTRSEGQKRAWANPAHKKTPLFNTGDGHPCSKAVMTPHGRFGSARQAAFELGMNPRTAQRWAGRRINGWSFEEA